MSIQNWLCRIRSRFVDNLRKHRATLRRPRASGFGMRGGAVPMTCGRETLESNARNKSLDFRPSDPGCVGVSPFLNSEVGESTSSDESVPVKLLFETPNIRLFEIGIDEVYGYANYGWTETSEGSWGAGGDAGNHQPGSKSLWVTLTKRQSVSLRTENGWLLVAIDGHETEICPAYEIEYLHIHGGDHTIDMTGIEKETLSSNLLIDLHGGAGNGTLIDSADADCLVVDGGNDQICRRERNAAGLTWAKFGDDTATNLADGIETDGSDGCLVNEISNALMCDVAFVDSVNQGEDADDETEILATADDAIADDETLTESRDGAPAHRRIRPGMKMNL